MPQVHICVQRERERERQWESRFRGGERSEFTNREARCAAVLYWWMMNRILHWISSQRIYTRLVFVFVLESRSHSVVNNLFRLEKEGERNVRGCMGSHFYADVYHRWLVRVYYERERTTSGFFFAFLYLADTMKDVTRMYLIYMYIGLMYS